VSSFSQLYVATGHTSAFISPIFVENRYVMTVPYLLNSLKFDVIVAFMPTVGKIAEQSLLNSTCFSDYQVQMFCYVFVAHTEKLNIST